MKARLEQDSERGGFQLAGATVSRGNERVKSRKRTEIPKEEKPRRDEQRATPETISTAGIWRRRRKDLLNQIRKTTKEK